MRRSAPIFDHPKIRYFLGDVRDQRRLLRAFKEVNIVIHAAALKQVPAAEYNPSEFVHTNVLGSMNVIDAAIDCNVERVIALSSDKAVNPVNLYGAPTLCADKLFVAGNSYVGARGFPKFSVVRYGNVLGSRGSIIPLWRQMIAEGAATLPVTDARMTRFWITLEQSVDFVIQCFAEMGGGEIFIPKIPSMRILDLAQAMAPELPINEFGIREGEKLHELMIGCEDARHSCDCQDHYVILPELWQHQPAQKERVMQNKAYKPLPEGFMYTSDTNTQWLSVADIRSLIESGKV